jgi:hypothetical protein
MSSLLDKLAAKAASVEREKVSEQLFSAAFCDELEKLGYDVEMLKESGALGNVWSTIKGAVGIGKPALGGMVKKLDPKMRALKMRAATSRTPAMATGDFPVPPGGERNMFNRQDRQKIGSDQLIKEAFWGVLARAIPAIGRRIAGLVGRKAATGVAAKAVTGAATKVPSTLGSKLTSGFNTVGTTSMLTPKSSKAEEAYAR